MSKSTAEKLVSFMKERAGDYLRRVAHFDADQRELLYARDDVRDQYTEEEIDAIFEDRFFNSFVMKHQENLYVHGELNCHVRFFEDGIELHFPHDRLSGTAVAFDPHAVADIEGLINDALNKVYGEYPPAKA